MAQLGIVAALAREAGGLAAEISVDGGFQTLPNGVLLAVSGMGAGPARTAGESLIAAGVTALMSWGSAGALDAALDSGTLLLPERIVPVEGQDIFVDAPWHERLRRLLDLHMAVCTEPLAESAAVLSGFAAKRALRERTEAAAVDMESAALGVLAGEAGLPFLVVRAVADGAHVTIPESVRAALNRDGSLRLGTLLGRLLMTPGDWFALARLSRGFHRAQATLARAVDLAGHGFLAPV